jgi:predicted MFS family arabinose efflux permease
MSDITAESSTAAAGFARPGMVRAALGAVTTTIACVLPVFLVGGLAVQIGDELRFSPAGLGLAVSVYFGVSALASVPAGRLVSRYGPALTARAGIALAAASLLAVAAVARSFTQLVVILAAGAAANALGQLASNVSLAKQVPPHRQGLSFGLKQSAIPVSTLLSGAAVPAVALTLGWRWAFVVAAGFGVAALALVPPDGRARSGHPDRKEGERATASLVVVGLAATLAAGSANALGTFLVDSSVARGLAPGLAGLTLTLGGAVCVVGRVGGGWLADRRAGGHLPALALLLVVGSAGLALLALPGAAALVTGVLLGFGLGWAWPGLLNYAVVQLNPSAPAAATAITQTGVYAGGCVGPLAFGPVAAHAGYAPAWVSAAAAMLLAAGLMLMAGRMLTAAPSSPRSCSCAGQ